MEAFEDLDLAATDDLSLATMINNIGLDDGPSASDLVSKPSLGSTKQLPCSFLVSTLRLTSLHQL